MSSVRTILAALFTALGGFFLLALTGGAGFAIYLATTSDSAVSPAEADAVSSQPLMHAEVTSTPRQKVAWLASSALTRPLNAPAPVSNTKARIRQLQKALARAGCYEGPISGVWSDASKDAMRGFVHTTNAELPVDRPDDALIALVESNETAKCALGRAVETGTLGVGISLQTAASSTGTTRPTPILSDGQTTRDEPAMLGRAWAPAGMLAEPKDPATEKPIGLTVSNDTEPVGPPSVSSSLSAAHFEGDKPLPVARQTDTPLVVPDATSEPSAAPHAKPKKDRTARRRRARDDDVQTTISKSFNSLQRSLASMF